MSDMQKNAEQIVYHWDNHGRYRMVAGESEPEEIELARQYLAVLADRETLRQRLASVCGALADAGDVVFDVENPGDGVQTLVSQRDAMRSQLTAEREKRAALVAELKSTAEQIEDEYNSEEFTGDLDSAEAMAELLWHIVRKMKAADQLAALDQPAGEGA